MKIDHCDHSAASNRKALLYRAQADLLPEPMAEQRLLSVGLGYAGEICSTNVIALKGWHFKRLLNEFVHCFNDDRTHLGLSRGTSGSREEADKTDAGTWIVTTPKLGGVDHRYNLAT